MLTLASSEDSAVATHDTIRVLVADDDPLARRIICEQLVGDDIEIVGEARDGLQAVEEAFALRPDVVVMDLLMTGCDGIAATKQIISNQPDLAVVILSTSDNEELALLAVRAGAVGFLQKSISMPALARVVRGLGRGEAALDRVTTRRLISEFVRGTTKSTPARALGTQTLGTQLSGREQQVLALLDAGLRTEAIAARLGVSSETVRTHVKSILRKLKVHTREEAVAVARAGR